MRLIPFLALLILVAFFGPAEAQQPPKIPRVGYAASGGDTKDPGRLVEAFQRGLRDLGYIEGKNILVEYRYPGTSLDQGPGVIAELIQLKVDVLVSSSAGAIRAAKEATTTIPIVIVSAFDPVETGLVDSLAHPGGNITGITRLTHELSGKRLELFKEAVPRISRVGILAAPGSSSLKEYEPAARALKISLQSLEVDGPNPDLAGIFQSALKTRMNGLITVASSSVNRFTKQIVELAIRNRVPSMHEISARVEAGGLMSYSADDAALFRRAAVYVDKILKGAKPGEMPLEQPTKFELAFNLKTAKQIGLTIPPTVLARADRVIR
ncbi:MAG TPA: ABC transporter substrate-binding protein [Candidatus Binatia bacterium]|jgi:putative ABC transport system substrate-binding protein